nr:MAG TPA: hypothetical protein [Caudoviricetes sp.]
MVKVSVLPHRWWIVSEKLFRLLLILNQRLVMLKYMLVKMVKLLKLVLMMVPLMI